MKSENPKDQPGNGVDGESYVDTWNSEPFDAYRRFRSKGKVAWDPGLKAWITTDYNVCRHVFRTDKKAFRKLTEQVADHYWYEILGDRDVMFLDGEDHTRYHRYWVSFFSPKVVDAWRAPKIRPIIDATIDHFEARGRADLFSDLAEQISPRVIMSVCGLPWDGDELFDRCMQLVRTRMAWNQIREQAPNATIAEGAVQSIHALKEMVDPIIAERQQNPTGDDLISSVWRDGSRLFADWDATDTFYTLAFMLFAGSETTAYTISSALYVLATHPSLQSTLGAGGNEAIENFTEEALRLFGSTAFVARLSNEDVELGDVHLKKDERIFALTGAANRDPSRWPSPETVDLQHASHDHLAFSLGPHTCAGAALARAEIQETVAAVLRRLPGLRMDPASAGPQYVGSRIRGYRPVNVVFGG